MEFKQEELIFEAYGIQAGQLIRWKLDFRFYDYVDFRNATWRYESVGKAFLAHISP